MKPISKRSRNVRVGEAAGPLDLAPAQHRTEQLRLHVHPVDLHVGNAGGLQQDRNGVVHGGARPAGNLATLKIGGFTNAGVAAGDDRKRRLVEADIDREKRRRRVRGVETNEGGHVDPAELVGAAGDADRHVGGSAAGVDGIGGDAFGFEVALLLRDEERRMRALDDPVQHDLDVLHLGGARPRRENANEHRQRERAGNTAEASRNPRLCHAGHCVSPVVKGVVFGLPHDLAYRSWHADRRLLASRVPPAFPSFALPPLGHHSVRLTMQEPSRRRANLVSRC